MVYLIYKNIFSFEIHNLITSMKIGMDFYKHILQNRIVIQLLPNVTLGFASKTFLLTLQNETLKLPYF